MPKLSIPFDIDITPEKFLRNCSNLELRELDLLLQSPHYQVRMFGTHTPEAKEKVITQNAIEK